MRFWMKVSPMGMLVLCLLALSSCSSNDGDGADPGNATPEERAVNATMITLTTFAEVGGVSPFVDLAGLPLKPGQACTTLPSICSGGTVEFCSSQTGGFVNFRSCSIGGLPVNGTINITSSQGNVGLSLEVGPYDVGAEGSYFFHAERERFYQTLDLVTVSDPSTWTVNLAAADWDWLGVAEPTMALGPPHVVKFSGTYTDLTTTPPTVLFIQGESVPAEEGPAVGDIRLRVYSAGSFEEPLLVCEANLADGSASCNPGE